MRRQREAFEESRDGKGDADLSASVRDRPSAHELFGDTRKHEFLITRILGNDLHPRHDARQTIENLRFILDTEAEFPGAKKLFIVNRIFNPDSESAVLDALSRAGAEYVHLPFEPSEYRAKRWDEDGPGGETALGLIAGRGLSRQEVLQVRLLSGASKIRYAMNVNGARNLALSIGKPLARWTLPLDGNCILTEEAFSRLAEQVRSEPLASHVVLPFERLEHNSQFHQRDPIGRSDEEPQIAFHHRSPLEFDERFPYGLRDKAELLIRLGVPGAWHDWPTIRWLPQEHPQSCLGDFKLSDAKIFRLSSGQHGLERKSAQKQRYRTRNEAIFSTLLYLDELTDAPDRDLGQRIVNAG
ncbi:hypothetical protein [Oricola sp.]|uniref:hypothetical protein n=1 Tax=Oricola sp. TaxID=1979950 RepID=UPI0025F2C39D|nr:hypothetical protein [Oricola sp.]MCI5073752.1 hypothetical protein [Oricola sp.]